MLKLSIKNIKNYNNFSVEIKNLNKLNFIDPSDSNDFSWFLILESIRDLTNGKNDYRLRADEFDITGDFSITLDWKNHIWQYLISVDDRGKVVFEGIFIDSKLAIYCDILNKIVNTGESIPIFFESEVSRFDTFWTKIDMYLLSNIIAPLYCASSAIKLMLDSIKIIDIDREELNRLHSYSTQVFNVYRKLMTSLDLGIYDVSRDLRYNISKNKDNNFWLNVTNMGSGVRTLQNILPGIIDSVINNKICVVRHDFLWSLNPVLKRYLFKLYKRFHRSKLIIFTYECDPELNNYYIESSDVLKTQSKNPQILIYE